MATGPTQNYDDATLGRWRPHPVLARVVRAALLCLPLLLALGFGVTAVLLLPPERLGVHPWWWLAGQVACSTALLLVTGRLVRRLLPLSTLLRMTLYVPDRAPSRFAVARRRYSPEALRGRDDAGVLELVAALSAHDRTTFRHSERVQAYSALLGAELGLSGPEAARLSWAALLHDVGKLHVPSEILNKTGRPSQQEWDVLATHPAQGAEIAAPMADWLGPWGDAIGQHHERWDGEGYPRGLSGTEISLGARIVAVADAYDVITSARPYKQPLSAEAAREELARCAGHQFDPEVVRALLAVSLGRLRTIAGPFSVLTALPGLTALRLPDLGSTFAGAGAQVSALSAGVTASLATAAVAVGTPLLAPLGLEPQQPSSSDVAVHDGSLPRAAPSDRGSGEPQVPVRTPRPGTPSASPSASPSTSPGTSPTADPQASAQPGGPGAASPRPDRRATTTPPAPRSTTSPPQPPASPTARPSSPSPPKPDPGPPPPAAETDRPTAACTRALDGVRNLADADLGSCDLAGADLTGVDLSGARLTGADLSDAKLNGATFRGTTVSGTSFDGADLQGADFTGAVITGCSFVGADMTPTTLRGAQVRDSVLG